MPPKSIRVETQRDFQRISLEELRSMNQNGIVVPKLSWMSRLIEKAIETATKPALEPPMLASAKR